MLNKSQPIVPLACYRGLLSLYCNAAFIPCQDVYVTELQTTGNNPSHFRHKLTSEQLHWLFPLADQHAMKCNRNAPVIVSVYIFHFCYFYHFYRVLLLNCSS
jgi:hypothetical protein